MTTWVEGRDLNRYLFVKQKLQMANKNASIKCAVHHDSFIPFVQQSKVFMRKQTQEPARNISIEVEVEFVV